MTVIFLAIIIPFAQIRRPGVIPAKYFFALWKSGRAKYTKLKPGNIFGVEFHGDLHGGQMPEPKGKRHINSDCPCDIELRNAIRHRRGGAFSTSRCRSYSRYSKFSPLYFTYCPPSYSMPKTSCRRAYTLPLVTFCDQDEPAS